MTGLAGSVAANVVTTLLAWRQRRRWFLAEDHAADLEGERDELAEELAATAARLADVQTEFQAHQARYDLVKQQLAEAGIAKTFHQPVLLVGPRGVGKTSLLARWEVPWETARPSPTFSFRRADVLVQELEAVDTEAHYVDPTIRTCVHAQIKLRVWDFPGELNGQRQIERVVRDQTRRLRDESKRDLGVVIVCMFDASEVAAASISEATRAYYTAELFAQLRSMTFYQQAKLERLVLVFNKIDQLRALAAGERSEEELAETCRKRFLREFPELGSICHPEKVCAVATMLDATSGVEAIRGAPVVLREASRGILEAFSHPADDVKGAA